MKNKVTQNNPPNKSDASCLEPALSIEPLPAIQPAELHADLRADLPDPLPEASAAERQELLPDKKTDQLPYSAEHLLSFWERASQSSTQKPKVTGLAALRGKR